MTLSEFKRLNKEKSLHWFDRPTMHFFSSIVSNWHSDSGYFISSERQSMAHDRRYTVRKANFETGQVATIGQFQEYATIKQAQTKIKQILTKGET